MAKFRVYTELSGNVRVLHPNEKMREVGETDDVFIARIGAHAEAADPSLAGLPSVDVLDTVVSALDRSKRHKWRVSGGALNVDNTVPDPPNPKQGLINAINAAGDINAIKAILRQML